MDDIIGSTAEDVTAVSGSELGNKGGGRGGGVTTDGDRKGGVAADGDKLKGDVSTIEGRIEGGRGGGVMSDGDRVGVAASESDKFGRVAADDDREGNIEGGRGGGVTSDGDKSGGVGTGEDITSVSTHSSLKIKKTITNILHHIHAHIHEVSRFRLLNVSVIRYHYLQ